MIIFVLNAQKLRLKANSSIFMYLYIGEPLLCM